MTSRKLPTIPEPKRICSLYRYLLGTKSQYIRSNPRFRGINDKQIRNIAKTVYYFEKYAKFKKEMNDDKDSPWELNCAFMGYSSNMPKCVKWARQFLAKRIEVK
jgi:bacterioferritin-associated ferredoxin